MKFDIIDLDQIEKSTRTITGIVIHHSASGPFTTARDIDEWHTGRGWNGIGYHYVVGADCQVYEGRDINIDGAHTKGHNENTIGICVIGNFSQDDPKHPPYAAQMIATANLVNRLRDIYQVECDWEVGDAVCNDGILLNFCATPQAGAAMKCPRCKGTSIKDIPVTGHREHNATECPGTKVDLDQMRNFFDFMRTVT